jgi:hypothetical protein
MSRSFTLLVNGVEKGRYLSSAPVNAAKKAFNELLRSSKKSKSLKAKKVSKVITLLETTQGKGRKEYVYKVTRKLLKEPKRVMKDGVEILFKYETDAKRQ